MHILDQGVSFSKLSKNIKIQKFRNDFWRTLVAFWPTVRCIPGLIHLNTITYYRSQSSFLKRIHNMLNNVFK